MTDGVASPALGRVGDMSEPDPMEQADASFRQRKDLEDVAGATAPIGEDESFAIEDLTDEEWDRFTRAIDE